MKGVFFFTIILSLTFIFGIVNSNKIYLHTKNGMVYFPDTLNDYNHQLLRAAYLAEQNFVNGQCQVVNLIAVTEIFALRDEDCQNTTVELAQVSPDDQVTFKVCRIDDLTSFTIEINNRTIPIPTPNEGALINCFDTCIIDISMLGNYNGTIIKVKPGSIITFINSNNNATIDLNQILPDTCDIVDGSIFNFAGISTSNPFEVIIPRSLVGQTVDFSVFPFCQLSQYWRGKIVVGKVVSQVFTLHFPKYYYGDSCLQKINPNNNDEK